jgi:hypothetical protein
VTCNPALDGSEAGSARRRSRGSIEGVSVLCPETDLLARQVDHLTDSPRLNTKTIPPARTEDPSWNSLGPNGLALRETCPSKAARCSWLTKAATIAHDGRPATSLLRVTAQGP